MRDDPKNPQHDSEKSEPERSTGGTSSQRARQGDQTQGDATSDKSWRGTRPDQTSRNRAGDPGQDSIDRSRSQADGEDIEGSGNSV